MTPEQAGRLEEAIRCLEPKDFVALVYRELFGGDYLQPDQREALELLCDRWLDSWMQLER